MSVYVYIVRFGEFGIGIGIDKFNCYIGEKGDCPAKYEWIRKVNGKKKKLTNTACIQLFNKFQSLTLQLITIKLDTS